jgi:hypothetical protein
MKTLLDWRKNNKAVIEGDLIHYAPGNDDCYVYARIKDDRTTLVILNGGDKDQQLGMDRFSDVIGSYTTGVDVTTGKKIDITSQLNVPARGAFVMDLK